MTTFDAGVLKGAAGQPDQHITFHKTVHGPVVGYANVGGRRVAISSQALELRPRHARPAARSRTSRCGSVRDAAAVHPRVPAHAADVQRVLRRRPAHRRGHDRAAAACAPRTSTRACRRTATATTSGAASCPPSRTRRQIDPSSGADRQLEQQARRAASRPPTTPGATARATASTCSTATWATAARQPRRRSSSAMNAAATQDLRAIDVVPALVDGAARRRRRRARGRARCSTLLRHWRDNGGSRLDRDLDGKIDDPGAAIMDAVWPKLADAVMGAGPRPADRRARVDPAALRRAAGRPGGGWHSYVVKDLRDLLGRSPAAPFRVRFCGAGDAATCRASLWAAIDAAGDELAAAQGHDPAAWRSDATGADHVRAGPAEDDAALHEPADRHPAGHLVQGAPRRRSDRAPAARRPWSACARSASRCRRPPSARATARPRGSCATSAAS